jgi:hypothetical protein
LSIGKFKKLKIFLIGKLWKTNTAGRVHTAAAQPPLPNIPVNGNDEDEENRAAPPADDCACGHGKIHV